VLILLLISLAASAVVFFLVLPVGLFWAIAAAVAAGVLGIFAGGIWSVYRARRAQSRNQAKATGGRAAEGAQKHPERLEPRTPPAV
jgi:hypothetical protein